MDPARLQIEHDPESGRFQAALECGQAYVAYRRRGDALDLVSTWVPRQHRHVGIGERMVVHALEYARRNGLRVVPTCPFVPSVLADHPEYADLVVSGAPAPAERQE